MPSLTPYCEYSARIGDIEVGFRQIHLPNERIIHGKVFPYALQVERIGGDELTIDDTTAAVRKMSEDGFTSKILGQHGALILRGTPEPSPRSYSRLVHAAEQGRGHFPYEQIGLAGSRTILDEEVFTASEAPPNLWIHAHNEYSRYTKFPSNIHFYCWKSPPKGGESPFCHSGELFDRVNETIPDFVNEANEKGLMSPEYYQPPGKEFKNFIYTWAGDLAFGQEIDSAVDDMPTMKAKAEKQIRRLTPHFKWLDDDRLQVHQYIPAFRRSPATGKPVFFSSIPGRYGTAFDRGATDPPYKGDDGMYFLPPVFADGTTIPKKYLHTIWDLSKELAVEVKTQPGDLALVDNFQVMHARAPWSEGEHKILVSMWDTDKPEEQILAY